MTRDLWPMGATARNLATGFLLLTALPVAALIWLGFELHSQDRQLMGQREAERRELAAGRVVSALEQALTQSERGLSLSSPVREGAIRLRMQSRQLEVRPAGGIPYFPAMPELREAPAQTFEAAENLEFRGGDLARAMDALERLAQSPDAAVRAGALMRLARNQRKAGRLAEALETYRLLAQLNGVAVAGVPADLAARRARSGLLNEMGRAAEAGQESGALQQDLERGRWRIDRAAYLHYAQEAPGADRAALAEAAAWLWNNYETMPASGRKVLLAEGRAVAVLWHKFAAGVDALAALPAFQQSAWFSQLPAGAGAVTLALPTGETVFGSLGGAPAKAVRPATETGLPWNVIVANIPGTEVTFTARRRLLLAGFIALIFLLAAGAYSIARAVAREMSVKRLQSDFVAAVSHEFRTPLTSMLQFTELLMQDKEPPPEKRQAFYRAQARATGRLHRLVESLLDFGRMEAGRHPYERRPLDAGELVDSVVAQFRQEVEPRGFTVEWAGAAPLMRIHADPDALARALWNLLDNAAKYSGDSRWIGVEAAREDGGILLRVRDRGIGVPSEERERIFEKFVRGARAREDGIKGTGIGLAMVRHIVEAHRGQVRLEPGTGPGSTFTIRIPAEE